MHTHDHNNFPACGTRTGHRNKSGSIQARWDGYQLNSSAATAQKPNIIAKTEAENRRVNADFVDLTQRFTRDPNPEGSAKAAEDRRADADLVEMVAPRIARDPSPEESAKAWAEYDRVTTEAWAEYLSITNKSAYLFERAMDPDTLPEYLRGIAGSFVEYRRAIAVALDVLRSRTEADRFPPRPTWKERLSPPQRKKRLLLLP